MISIEITIVLVIFLILFNMTLLIKSVSNDGVFDGDMNSNTKGGEEFWRRLGGRGEGTVTKTT